MSGYTDATLRRQRVTGTRQPFLAKPFRPDDLAATVRKVLDAPAR